MTEISKPDFTYRWSSGGAIVAPSNTKIQTGWTAEVPPFQWENWSQNRQDDALVHIFQKGISVWSSTQDYYFAASAPKAFVQGSDGLIYEAVQSSTNQNPTTDTTNTYWRLAFRNQSGAPVYAPDTGTANAYKADYVPVVKTLVDGMVLKFKALNANTTASTFTPANGVISPAAIVGLNHSALQGGEIIVNGDIWLQWNSSLSGGSWVMVANSGGAVQVAQATNTNHAVRLSQLASGRQQRFTSSGSFTVPAGVTTILVSGVGGGGGGGGTNSTSSASSGGGGGGGAGQALILQDYTVTPGQVLVVTIGAAGAAGTGGVAGVGGAGGSTTLGGLVTLTGGGGGAAGGTASNINSVGGLGGGGSPGGSHGGDSGAAVGAGSYGAAGGTGPFGGGGRETKGTNGNALAGGAAFGYGTGGSGGGGINGNVTATGAAGGIGTPGILIIEW